MSDELTNVDKYRIYYTPVNLPESIQNMDPQCITLSVFNKTNYSNLEEIKQETEETYDQGGVNLLNTEVEEKWDIEVLKTRTQFEGITRTYEFLHGDKLYVLNIFESSEFDNTDSDYYKMFESIKFDF